METLQPDVFHTDELRARLDKLFYERVGEPPSTQDDLNKLYAEGAERYKRKIPPGYMDEKKLDECYTYRGLILERRYGDLLIWKQILQKATDNNVKHIVFVTDDDKEDWWWTAASKGKKTIGPRPELIHEIKSLAGVEDFYMYNSERFMRFAGEHLKIEITGSSITQVRDVTRLYAQRQRGRFRAHVEGVRGWIEAKVGPAELTGGFPDVICTDEQTGRRLGFEIKAMSRAAVLPIIWKEVYRRAAGGLEPAGVDSLTIMAVLPNEEEAQKCLRLAHRMIRRTELPSGWSIVVGTFDGGDSPGFTPLGTVGP